MLYEVGRKYSQQLARSFAASFADAPAGRRGGGVLLPRARDRLPAAAAPGQGVRAGRRVPAGLVHRCDAHRRPGPDGGAPGDLRRRGRLVEPAPVPARGAAGRRLLRRAVRALGRVREALRRGRRQRARDLPRHPRLRRGAGARRGPRARSASSRPRRSTAGATRRAGCLREAVARTDIKGATGRIRFDARGDRIQGVALYAVEPTPEGPRARPRGWLGER